MSDVNIIALQLIVHVHVQCIPSIKDQTTVMYTVMYYNVTLVLRACGGRGGDLTYRKSGKFRC